MNEKHFAKLVRFKETLNHLHATNDSAEARDVHTAASATLEDHKALFTDAQYKTLVAKSPEPS